MKQSFALLSAFLLLQMQIWAFSPNYPNNSQSVTGTYAGTLIGKVTFDSSGGVAEGANAAGVWVIGEPTAGLGTGVFAFFGSGSAYLGTAIAITTPVNGGSGGTVQIGTMLGVFDGQANVTETFTETNPLTGLTTPETETFVEGLCAINFTATITSVQNTSPGGQSGTLINGTGQATYTNPNATDPVTGLPVTPPPVIGTSTVIVTGYEQSTTVTNTVSLSTLTNTGGSQGAGSGS